MDIEARIVGIEKGLEYATERIDDLESTTKRIESLTLSVEKLAFSVEAMAKEQIEFSARQQELVSRVTEVENSPYRQKANMHDKILSSIGLLVIGAFVEFLLMYFLGI